MGDLVPMPTGLGRLTSQSPSTRAGQSWELLYPPQSPRRVTTALGRSRLTRRRDGADDFLCLRLRPRATRSTRPTPSRRPRWGTDGHMSAGLPGTIPPRLLRLLCAVCGGPARLTFRLHRNLTLRDRITNGTFDDGARVLKTLSTASAVATASSNFGVYVLS
jgi:hypothetical protein